MYNILQIYYSIKKWWRAQIEPGMIFKGTTTQGILQDTSIAAPPWSPPRSPTPLWNRGAPSTRHWSRVADHLLQFCGRHLACKNTCNLLKCIEWSYCSTPICITQAWIRSAHSSSAIHLYAQNLEKAVCNAFPHMPQFICLEPYTMTHRPIQGSNGVYAAENALALTASTIHKYIKYQIPINTPKIPKNIVSLDIFGWSNMIKTSLGLPTFTTKDHGSASYVGERNSCEEQQLRNNRCNKRNLRWWFLCPFVHHFGTHHLCFSVYSRL